MAIFYRYTFNFLFVNYKCKLIKQFLLIPNFLQEELEGKPSSEESSDEYSSDEDQKWVKELKSEYRSAKRKRIATEREDRKKSENEDNSDDSSVHSEPTIKPPKFYEIKEGEEFIGSNSNQLNSVQNSG